MAKTSVLAFLAFCPLLAVGIVSLSNEVLLRPSTELVAIAKSVHIIFYFK